MTQQNDITVSSSQKAEEDTKVAAESVCLPPESEPSPAEPKVKVVLLDAGRLDKALTVALEQNPDAKGLGLSRARVQQLLKGGHVLRDGEVITNAKHKAKHGEEYEVTIPAPVAADPQPEDIPLSIIYEDDDLLVIDKPAGLVVHPAAGHWEHTLVNALIFHCGDSLSGIGGVARPGIVHRLDKDTSGLMVVAKNNFTHQGLSAQFADRSLSRVYHAVVWGVPNPIADDIEGPIGRHPVSRQKMAVVRGGGKDALTHYKTLEAYSNYASLVECRLATGRTHQIRVHMQYRGHPLIGDPLYGRRKQPSLKELGAGIYSKVKAFNRQALHAGEIKFIHPRTEEQMVFKCPLPDDLAEMIGFLRADG